MVQSESGVVAYGPKDKSRMQNFSGPRNGPQKKRRRKNTGREGEREVASGPKAKSKIPNLSAPRKWPIEEEEEKERKTGERERGVG
jgi:hypothetical protein